MAQLKQANASKIESDTANFHGEKAVAQLKLRMHEWDMGVDASFPRRNTVAQLKHHLVEEFGILLL